MKFRELLNEEQLDFLYFGNYFYEDKTKVPFKWKVIKVTGNKALLIANDIPICGDMDKYSKGIYLTNFYTECFSLQEREAIIDNKCFLLTAKQAQTYFSSENDAKAKIIPYLLHKTFSTKNGNYASWWLDNKGKVPHSCASVDYRGNIDILGTDVQNVLGYRPAIKIDLKKYKSIKGSES